MTLRARLGLGLLLAAALGAGPAQARLFSRPAPSAAMLPDTALAEIQTALDEHRYLDAARMLDEAAVSSPKTPRLTRLRGDLGLALGRYTEALADYRQIDAVAAERARALEGEGIALSLLGRADEALATLKKAVAEAPTAWRAWNALGGEYDARDDWTQAEAAYAQALSQSAGAAIVLNNRGYSRLLQRHLDDAVTDLVAALRARPDLAEARTNLRLALAMKGDYRGAVAGGAPEDQASLLNNAGFAAALRGDYPKAEDLLGQAIKLRSAYYDKASENLKVVKGLEARGDAGP